MATVLFVGVLMFASPIILGCINSGCTQASHDGEVMGVDECITDLYVPICDKDMDGSIDKMIELQKKGISSGVDISSNPCGTEVEL
jgi:NADH:ubiquinone oxidoreductase subunit B-like Fe-S oxidoreductase